MLLCLCTLCASIDYYIHLGYASEPVIYKTYKRDDKIVLTGDTPGMSVIFHNIPNADIIVYKTKRFSSTNWEEAYRVTTDQGYRAFSTNDHYMRIELTLAENGELAFSYIHHKQLQTPCARTWLSTLESSYISYSTNDSISFTQPHCFIYAPLSSIYFTIDSYDDQSITQLSWDKQYREVKGFFVIISQTSAPAMVYYVASRYYQEVQLRLNFSSVGDNKYSRVHGYFEGSDPDVKYLIGTGGNMNSQETGDNFGFLFIAILFTVAVFILGVLWYNRKSFRAKINAEFLPQNEQTSKEPPVNAPLIERPDYFVPVNAQIVQSPYADTQPPQGPEFWV